MASRTRTCTASTVDAESGSYRLGTEMQQSRAFGVPIWLSGVTEISARESTEASWVSCFAHCSISLSSSWYMLQTDINATHPLNPIHFLHCYAIDCNQTYPLHQAKLFSHDQRQVGLSESQTHIVKFTRCFCDFSEY